MISLRDILSGIPLWLYDCPIEISLRDILYEISLGISYRKSYRKSQYQLTEFFARKSLFISGVCCSRFSNRCPFLEFVVVPFMYFRRLGRLSCVLRDSHVTVNGHH